MNREKIKEIIGCFPIHRTYLLPVLEAIQEEIGWIPAWAMEEVASYLRLPKSEVHGVASSFPDLRSKPTGEYVVKVCTGLPCHLKGSALVLSALEREVGVTSGETTNNKSISLEESSCLFICAMAPAMAINSGVFGRVSPEDALSHLHAIPIDKQVQE